MSKDKRLQIINVPRQYGMTQTVPGVEVDFILALPHSYGMSEGSPLTDRQREILFRAMLQENMRLALEQIFKGDLG